MARDVSTRKAESLTEALFALEEPWRSRFFCLIARRARGQADEDLSPTRDEVMAWLSNGNLQRAVDRLLRAWN
jgi:hypothetical protein